MSIWLILIKNWFGNHVSDLEYKTEGSLNACTTNLDSFLVCLSAVRRKLMAAVC